MVMIQIPVDGVQKATTHKKNLTVVLTVVLGNDRSIRRQARRCAWSCVR